MTYLIRFTYAATTTIILMILSAGAAFAPPMENGPTTPDFEYSFNEDAVLDTDQVIDPGPCTLRTFDYEGSTWAYCTEDGPESVDVLIP